MLLYFWDGMYYLRLSSIVVLMSTLLCLPTLAHDESSCTEEQWETLGESGWLNLMKDAWDTIDWAFALRANLSFEFLVALREGDKKMRAPFCFETAATSRSTYAMFTALTFADPDNLEHWEILEYLRKEFSYRFIPAEYLLTDDSYPSRTIAKMAREMSDSIR